MLFTIDGLEMTDIPKRRKADYQRWLKQLSPSDHDKIVAELNRLIDERAGQKFKPTSLLPGNDWSGSVFEPIFAVCGESVQAAGWFFGLIVWQTMIKRPEKWYFTDTDMPGREILGKVYFL
ncbi:MAG: hypothetical protein WC889_18610 [Myxococcota bacterium]|jgi:hypothetical protein